MSKETIKGLSGLQAAARDAGIGAVKVGGLLLRPIKPIQGLDFLNARAIKEAVDASLVVTRENMAKLTTALENPDEFLFVREAIFGGVAGMATDILSYPQAAVKQDFVNCVMAGAANFPANENALLVLAYAGECLHFWQKVDAPRSNSARLPFENEDGKIKWLYVITSHPGSTGIMPKIRVLCDKQGEAFHERVKRERDELKQGTDGTLHEVLNAGAGEATFWVPDESGEYTDRETEKKKPFFHPGGTIKIRVEDGKVYAVDVVGKCARKVKEIADSGVFITIRSLSFDRVDPKGLRDDKLRYTKLLHTLVRKGLNQLKQADEKKAKIDAVRAMANTGATELLVNGKSGMTYIFDSYNRDIGFVLELNGEGKIRVAAAIETCHALAEKFGEFQEPGKGFEKIGAPLGPMLRQITRRLERKVAEQHAKTNGNGSGDETDETGDEKPIQAAGATN